jgi:hypothetical protein
VVKGVLELSVRHLFQCAFGQTHVETPLGKLLLVGFEVQKLIVHESEVTALSEEDSRLGYSMQVQYLPAGEERMALFLEVTFNSDTVEGTLGCCLHFWMQK